MPLILLIIILISLSIINVRDKLWDSSAKGRQKEFDFIKSKITNQLEQDIICAFHRDRWNLVNSISNDLATIFGNQWADILNMESPDLSWSYRRNSVESFVGAWNIAFEVWYSKEGFIPIGRNKYNLTAIPLFDDTEMQIERCIQDVDIRASVSRAKRRILGVKICKIIEKNIRAAHPDLDLRLCNGALSTDDNYLVWEHWYKLSNIKPGLRPWYDE